MFAVLTPLLIALTALQSADAAAGDDRWRPPPPPEPIERLIEEAEVSFEFYDPDTSPRQYPGVTNFDASFTYRARHNYRVTGSGGSRRLVVRPQFSALQFERTHTIHLPRSLQGPEFFQHPLVLHELDHVRISNDRRWEQWFRNRVRSIGLLSVSLPPGTTPGQRAAEQVIRDEMEKAFREVQQLIEIRYRELDRLTQHGLKRLPESYWERFAEKLVAEPSDPPPAEPAAALD